MLKISWPTSGLPRHDSCHPLPLPTPCASPPLGHRMHSPARRLGSGACAASGPAARSPPPAPPAVWRRRHRSMAILGRLAFWGCVLPLIGVRVGEAKRPGPQCLAASGGSTLSHFDDPEFPLPDHEHEDVFLSPVGQLGHEVTLPPSHPPAAINSSCLGSSDGDLWAAAELELHRTLSDDHTGNAPPSC